jgi:5-methylcytosine-specific restriction endonuclease McrBC regulatory subunit McrC
MLFEYFVRKLLKRSGYFLQSKSEKSLYILTGGINNERKLIPDIVFTSSGKDYLFDVKYKHFDFTNGAKREDLFQLHTYVGQYGNHAKISACGFIHPIRAEEFEKKVKNDFIHNKIKINGHEVDFYILFIIVPDNNIDDYITKFKSYTDIFLDQIKKITKNQ